MPRGVKGSAAPNLKVHVKTEQERQLELQIQSLKVDLDNARERADDERTKRIGAEAREKETWKQLDKERQDANLLRTAVHDLEIDYAKLRGYIDGQHDSEPPRMVPEKRERRLASYPDGTRVYNMNSRYGEPETEWWKR